MDAATPILKSALAATAVSVKTTAGKVDGAEFYNPGAAVAYVQVFDATVANVTLGTDTPKFSIAVPAGGRAPWPQGRTAFNTAITAAATAGVGNAVAPNAPVVCNFNIR